MHGRMVVAWISAVESVIAIAGQPPPFYAKCWPINSLEWWMMDASRS